MQSYAIPIPQQKLFHMWSQFKQWCISAYTSKKPFFMPFGILQQRIERAESWANSCKIQSQASTLIRFIRNEIQPFCEFPEELVALQILKDHVYTIQAKLPEEITEGGANA